MSVLLIVVCIVMLVLLPTAGLSLFIVVAQSKTVGNPTLIMYALALVATVAWNWQTISTVANRLAMLVK